jgi:hypothetical protein
MFKSLLLLASLLIACPAIAQSPPQQNKQPAKTKWFLLHARDAKCILATDVVRQTSVSGFASPAALETEQRKMGNYIRTNIIRDDNDKIERVEVVSEIRDTTLTIIFYPDKEKCESDLKTQLDSGLLHDPKELE